MNDIEVDIPTQPIPPALDTARRALYRVLNAPPEDIADDLAVIEALALLENIHPPYPPAPADDVAWTLDEALPIARAALAQAIQHAGSVPDAVRLGLAARELGSIGPRETP